MQVTHRRLDGTFEIIHNGWPYHVIPGDLLWDEAVKAGADAPMEPVEPEKTPAERLAEWRATRSIHKADFLRAVANAGWLTDDDALSAGRGAWPEAMAGFLDYLSKSEARDVQLEWAARATVERMNADVAALAWWLGRKDAEVDAIFGWEK